jgi:hypothetical protein
MSMHTTARRTGFLVVGMFLLGCGAQESTAPASGGSSSDPNGVEQVSLDLSAAPAGAQCIRLTITPASGPAVVQTITITTTNGSGAPIPLGGLPIGPVTIAADAFTVACTSISGVAPNWSSDPTPVVVRPGLTTSLVLTFKPNTSVSITPDFVGSISGIVAGGYNSYVLTDGAPEGWGVYGVVPSGPTPTRSTVLTNTTTSIALGPYHGCALRSDGTIWCFGYNYYGGVGPNVALGSFTYTPVQVPLPGTASSICAGTYHACAVVNQNSAYCWGYNAQGQLGNGTTTNSSSPVLATTGTFRSISCGTYDTIATTGDGHYVAWGYDNLGQLGDGLTTNRLTAWENLNERTVLAVAAGDNSTCDLHADGSVWCWGGNFYGQLGDGTTTNRLTTAKVSLPATAKSIGVGYAHACALLTTGQVECWGENLDGELGDLTGTNHPTPTAVTVFGLETTASALAVGQYHSCVVTPLANVWCWGGNFNGGVGDGTYNDAFGPTKVTLQ